jgi:ATP-dependent DNA ligase
LRCFAYKGKLYTASGVLIVNAPLVEKALKQIPKIAKNYVFDGEIFYKSCDITKGIVKTQTPGHKLGKKLQLFTFDLISRKEWEAKKGTVPLKRRQMNLMLAVMKIRKSKRLKTKEELAAIQLFQYDVLEPTDKAVQKYAQQAQKDGHEGIMLKNPNAVYAFRKTKDWLKLKPYRENDLRVINVERGTDGKKNGKRLGALILKGVIDGVKVKTKCGGGFTDKQRDELWAMHKKGHLIGKIVEVKHEGLTKNAAVRFPEFRRLHPEKNI